MRVEPIILCSYACRKAPRGQQLLGGTDDRLMRPHMRGPGPCLQAVLEVEAAPACGQGACHARLQLGSAVPQPRGAGGPHLVLVVQPRLRSPQEVRWGAWMLGGAGLPVAAAPGHK